MTTKQDAHLAGLRHALRVVQRERREWRKLLAKHLGKPEEEGLATAIDGLDAACAVIRYALARRLAGK